MDALIRRARQRKLLITFGEKGRTVFVPKECVAEMTRHTRRFVRMKELFRKLTEVSVRLAKEQVLKNDRSKQGDDESSPRIGKEAGR